MRSPAPRHFPGAYSATFLKAGWTLRVVSATTKIRRSVVADTTRSESSRETYAPPAVVGGGCVEAEVRAAGGVDRGIRAGRRRHERQLQRGEDVEPPVVEHVQRGPRRDA